MVQRPAIGENGRVLVVDDHLAVRQSTAEMLRMQGYRVTEAESADEAVDCISQGDVSVLVVNLGLDRTGLRLLDRLADPPPIIMTSGLGENIPPTDPRVSVFLIKPIPPDRLLAEIDSLIRSEPTDSPLSSSSAVV